jgi:hypothetical protein
MLIIAAAESLIKICKFVKLWIKHLYLPAYARRYKERESSSVCAATVFGKGINMF